MFPLYAFPLSGKRSYVRVRIVPHSKTIYGPRDLSAGSTLTLSVQI